MMLFSRLVLAIVLGCLSGAGLAHTYTFEPAMLGEGEGDVDIALFNQGLQLPGTYRVDILLNGELVDSREVVFSLAKDARGESSLQPCLSVAVLSRYGVRVENYPQLSAHGECAQLSAISQLKSDFQFNNQQLFLSIPQVSLRPKLTGIAPQQLWDDGIPALLLNYSANTNRTEYRDGMGRDTDSTYAQLNPGANLGAWRLRNQTNWQKQKGTQAVYTYADRGLYDLKSRLTLGERATPGDIFDGVPFRGVMLGSDDNMVPYNQRVFAPVVRGIARTQARVEVKQNGYTIYSATVAPGPFALTDLSTQGTSGADLQVIVWETDGNSQVFTVPYQTPAIALREGYLKYNVMGGQYRPADSAVGKKTVGQVTVMYGLPWSLTAYAGLQSAEHFQGGALGLGWSMGEWGALSLDETRSHGQRKGKENEEGNAWRVRYSKEIAATNTTLSLSNQYASSGYNTLADVLDTWRDNDPMNREPGHSWDDYRRKSSTVLTLSQSMGPWGYFNLNSAHRNYQGRAGYENTFGVSYGTSVRNVSLTLGWTQNKQVSDTGEQRTNRLISLWVSVPLDRWLGGSGTTNATYQLTSSSEDGGGSEAGLNGQAFDRHLNWDMRQRYRPGDVGVRSSSTLRMTWYGGYGLVGGNYSYSPNLRQMGADVAGGMVVHHHGITFGHPLGTEVALIEAPGATGVSVVGWSGVKTDFRGYTTQSNLTPYQENTVSLDPTSLPPDAEVSQTDIKVVPTQGAIVPAKFITRIGGRALMTLTRPDGKVVPFGALTTLEGGGSGVVGEGGQVYLTGLPEQGEMLVRWAKQQCRVGYHLPKEADSVGIYVMTGECR